MSPFNLHYASKRMLAKFLARVELHDIQTLATADGDFVWKSRRRASQIAVNAGNLFVRMERTGVEVLNTDEWHRWESAVWLAKNSDACDGGNKTGPLRANPFVRSKGLMIPRSPGVPLRHILADSGRPLEDKLRCLGWALRSLQLLHARQADWGDGLVQPISHGDATAENVIIDLSKQCGDWIDFDTRHQVSLPAIERHADDVRALVFSTAVDLAQTHYQKLSAQLRVTYRRREVLVQFRSWLMSNWHRPSTFQLAQAPLPFAAARALSEVLVADLE